ncbi:MAG: hypothetical protein ACRCU5_04370, partial [Rhizobiaceae bacterium]
MFWKAKPTINEDDEQRQLEAWRWLIDNLGGLDVLAAKPTQCPSHKDFPKSGLSGHQHVAHVFGQIAQKIGVDPNSFKLVAQDTAIDAVVGPLAVVANVPLMPAGTYQLDGNSHLVSYDPALARDLEKLIGTLAHEICHPILFNIPTAPPGNEDAEEFATDLATVFFGFGLFGGNQSFQFNQFRDDATGTQGWSTQRLGYLSQNEW